MSAPVVAPVTITEEEFSKVYSAKFGMIVVLLTQRGKCTRDDAEEFSQRAWMKAWTHRAQWRGIGQFQQWVMAIAWRLMLVDLRQKRKHDQVAWEDLDARYTSVTPNYEPVLLTKDLLQNCDPFSAAVLSDYYLRDGELKSPQKRSRLFRARAACREGIGYAL